MQYPQTPGPAGVPHFQPTVPYPPGSASAPHSQSALCCCPSPSNLALKELPELGWHRAHSTAAGRWPQLRDREAGQDTNPRQLQQWHTGSREAQQGHTVAPAQTCCWVQKKSGPSPSLLLGSSCCSCPGVHAQSVLLLLCTASAALRGSLEVAVTEMKRHRRAAQARAPKPHVQLTH